MRITADQLKVALDAGKTLEDLGITQEEMDEITAAANVAEPGESADKGEGQQDPGVVEPDAIGEGLDASAVEILSLQTLVEVQKAEVIELSEKVQKVEAEAVEMKEIVIGVLNNRRIALGLAQLDMGAFSTASILADYKAVSDQFEKSFKTGGIFKKEAETKKAPSVTTDRAHAGLLQAAA